MPDNLSVFYPDFNARAPSTVAAAVPDPASVRGVDLQQNPARKK